MPHVGDVGEGRGRGDKGPTETVVQSEKAY